ncbi:hypothetical protein Mgra_00004189 [Meloidogyne graminicola]|uniref:Uncharacterized protein n=1 Tax=Meloidogyne graminicola TaxID=189291 RepID=A0A8S9ZSG8_9BILA|nr:hypothetical protein Mgra_00004189 [Meloidogyne graminicola]
MVEKYIRRSLSDLSKAVDDDLVMSIEQELFTVTSEQKYPEDRTNFKIMVCDDIESKTYGCFQHRHNTLLSLSTRVVLNDVQTIRKNYPNLSRLFKANVLDKCDALDTEKLTDNDLQLILLSPNAKKFVIARELLYASSSKYIMPFVICFLSSIPSFALCYFLRSCKINDWIALISSAALGVLCAYLFILIYYKYETFSLDYETARMLV